MIYFFKPLPHADMNFSNYKPFIKNDWFRRHFMKFVYALQLILIFLSIALGVWSFSNWFIKVAVLIATFLCHELLHILVVYKIGDISLTHSGIFFWLESSAVMSKKKILVIYDIAIACFEHRSHMFIAADKRFSFSNVMVYCVGERHYCGFGYNQFCVDCT